MKKFAALLLAIMLVMSMALVGITAASAAEATGLDFSQKGTLTLKKGDSSAETPTETPVSGATFTAYKVYALSAESETNSNATLVPTDDFKAALSEITLTATGSDASQGALLNSTEELEAIIPALVKVSSNVTGTDSTEGEAGTYTISGLDLGIYLVVETSVPDGYYVTSEPFLVTVPQWENDAWKYEIEAKPKDAPVTLDKEVKENGGDNYVESDVYAIGQTVPFKVTTKIPDYGTKKDADGNDIKVTDTVAEADREKLVYTFTDTFSAGLTFVEDSITVTVGDNTIIDTNEADLCTKTFENNVLTLAFNWYNALNDHQGEMITLTYSAVLNENAVTVTANPNTMKLEFSNDLQKFEPTVKVDDAKVYTFEMLLNKTFDGTNNLPEDVENVTFRLSTDPTAETYIPVKAVDGGYVTDWDATGETVNYDFKLNEDGKVNVRGLKDGEYYLEETVAADGYSKLSSRVKIVVGEVEDTTSGDINVKANNYIFNANGEVIENELSLLDGNKNGFEITVNNVKKQFNLPMTGGLGIWMFTISGAVALAAAIIILTVVRKKKANK